VDLTGMSARMSIKDDIGGTELLHLTSADGDLTVNPSTYTVGLRISPAVTEGLDWETGYYDIELFTANDVYLLCYGRVTVTQEVTTSG
jgi:hypothetical protein